MRKDRLRITMPHALVQQLIARCPLDTQQHSPIISRDLDRYYFLLDRARLRLRELLDPAETEAICEACRQDQPRYGAWEPWNIPLLYTHVLEAAEGNLSRPLMVGAACYPPAGRRRRRPRFPQRGRREGGENTTIPWPTP